MSVAMRKTPDGDPTPALTPAQQQLVTSVLGLVGSLVNQIWPYAETRDREDMVSAGRLAAVRAAARYDPGSGTRFSSYAHPYIAGAIVDWTRRERTQKNVKRGASAAARGFVAETSDEFNVMWSGEATNRGLLETYTARLLASMAAGVAMAAPGLEDELAGLEDQRRAVTLVRAAVERMNEVERKLVQLRYGEGRTMQEIAGALGVSMSTARRWHEALLNKIEEELRERDVTGVTWLVEMPDEEDPR
jgi:RNA polymerase sigma factor (sigma-70 family)